MALKIFVSSVYKELREERLALQEEIQRLEDLFVGMEVFGSDPGKPADYIVERVQESDLYVGLFGDDYGSIDPASGISFTQVEYEAAVSKHIPCLIFFKGSLARPTKDSLLGALREKLKRDQIVKPFTDSSDLKVQFLRDFIKLLRADLFDKIVPGKRVPIPAGLLLSLTQQFIKEQVKSVGQDKYIPELYVARDAEKTIARFTHFEDLFAARAATILQSLESMRDRHLLGEKATEAIAHARIALKDVRESVLLEALEKLKPAFYFQEIEDAIESVNSVILEPSEQRCAVRANELVRQWHGKPFIKQDYLPDLESNIRFENLRSTRAKALDTSLTYQTLLEIFPSVRPDKLTVLANDLIRELSQLVQAGLKRCLVVVDRAGTGKTNIVCHLAEQLSVDQPVILLSGHMELSSEFDIEAYIERELEAMFSGIFTDWITRVSTGLQQAGKWLFIIIDAINENTRRPLLIRLLKRLLPKFENRRIKLILTCRDLFWDVFRDTIQPHLFENVIALHRFSEAEWHQAIKQYFVKFNIACDLSKEAREALRAPLLLRFFCEGNRDRRLGPVSNLRLLSVFDVYVERTGQSIAEHHGSLRPDALLNLLLEVAGRMWEERAVAIDLDSIGIREDEKSDTDSLYNMVLSENIILEEATHLYSTRKTVRFLYEEFMEYAIARSWVDKISRVNNKSPVLSLLVQEAAQALTTFPAALGAVLFLDKMLTRGGRLINDLIVSVSKLEDITLRSQQTPLVYAFESVDFAHADDELMAVVEKFEPTVREDLRERMAAVILRILEAHPGRTYARKYVQQLLEVDQKQKRIATEDLARRRGEQAEAKYRRGVDLALRITQGNNVPVGLPPARYHYSEDTKISAIGLLVQLKDRGDYDLIDSGIRTLGRSDLHNALQALQYVDLANDELVLKSIASYMNAPQSEYRIYCAWLLRERYGKDPARFLTKLLTDPETRVHRYTVGLFQLRLIEPELIETILRKIETDGADLKPWHLTNFIKLLGKRQNFYPNELQDTFGPRIVATLSRLLNHPQGSLRLEVYRTISISPSINLHDLKQKMQEDSDVYIRALAQKL
jgi:hypothetical protein